MELIVIFVIFVGVMMTSLILGLSMIIPLSIGFVLFFFEALRRGFAAKEILKFAFESVKDSFIVVGILLLIGCLTGMWRLNGTVAYFITLGVSSIPPKLFLLAAFLLTALMSYALGTSFGVTATAGVILISIARAGGVDPVLTAGAIMSGVYIGDRGSPAASSGNLVAVLTHTDMRKNVRLMLRTSIIPFFVCVVIYLVMSFFYPMQSVDNEVFGLLEGEFSLSPLCLIPAICMIVLPFLGVKIRISMIVSLVVSVFTAVFVQGSGAVDVLKAIFLGFEPGQEALYGMLSGGGILSMAQVGAILLISGSYGGIFKKTKLLTPLTDRLQAVKNRIGRYPTMLVMSALVCSLFCNQTIGIMMESQLTEDLYGDSEEERYSKMLDIENSVVLVAGLIPWCIASSVPLAMLGVGKSALLFSFYLWLVPLFYLFSKRSRR